MTINSAKRLSAASKKLIAGIDRRRIYSIFERAITTPEYDDSELSFVYLTQIFVALGHKDLLLDFIDEIFNDYDIMRDLENLVSKEGLSKVEKYTLVDLADLYEERGRRGPECILTNIVNGDEDIRDDVLSYLNKHF